MGHPTKECQRGKEMRIISYRCEDDLGNGLRYVKMFGNQLDSDKAGLCHDEMDLFDVGDLKETGMAVFNQAVGRLARRSAIGWVNFSEFEITVCGSCKMSTTNTELTIFCFVF